MTAADNTLNDWLRDAHAMEQQALTGGVVEGAAEVMSRYESDARSFDTGSGSDLEIVHMSANGEIGYWAGFQNAKARLKGRTETIPMRLRVTEIFRKEEGEWRLIHRHADPLSKEK